MRRLAITLLLLTVASSASAARLTIRNIDAAGTGFNDPTPVTPVPGNPGTTLGQQRMNVFLAAAEAWGKALESDVEIIVEATFSPIRTEECTETKAILGHARAMEFILNFPNAPMVDVYYPIALANKLAGVDLKPSTADIFTGFNADVDNDTCLGETNWYYGLDRQPGNDWDLFVVVLHELAHGLGISGRVAVPQFADNLKRSSIFETRILDTSTGLRWDQMTLAQRQTSLLNTANVVWDGPRGNTAARQWLLPTTVLSVSAPASIAGPYDIGTASFGAPVSRTPMSGSIVAAVDPATDFDGDPDTVPTTTDGCSAFTNAAQVAGKIALVDRGECPFVTKTRNAQNAGAVGIVIVDNRKEECIPPGMAPSGDTSDLVIPVMSIRQTDGALIRAQLDAGVTGRLLTDASALAGTARNGAIRLYTPCTAKPGSSVFHVDVTASPNMLMEPDVNTDLLHGLDITPEMLQDLGWTAPPRTGRRVLRR